MLYGIPQAAGKLAVGVVGVTVLATSANAVTILAEAVRRAISQSYAWATSDQSAATSTKTKPAKDAWDFRDFTPYSSTKDWTTLGLAAVKNIVLGTAALYVAHRFCPSLVTSANSLLHNVVGIQFTPHHIPLTKLAGL
ncbi:MAG TPA: hypothetical protein VIJ14_01855 [Rhabdochlamydiaceae bacterium]